MTKRMKAGRNKTQQRRVTVSLSSDLLRFADKRAERIGASRSAVMAEALAVLRRAKRGRELEEGYRFYTEADRDLAEEGMAASNEVWPRD